MPSLGLLAPGIASRQQALVTELRTQACGPAVLLVICAACLPACSGYLHALLACNSSWG